VRVLRSTAEIKFTQPAHTGEFLFWIVLQGELNIDENHQFQTGDSCVIPAGIEYALRAGAGLELLSVSLPTQLLYKSFCYQPK
jgi:mannose-6-phosphate isomerase-like protein (cupin superfamily)